MRLLITFLLCSASLAGADTFLIKSANAGRTWTDIDPAAGRFLDWFQIDSHGSALYALTHRDPGEEWHLSVSMDGGLSWQIRQTLPREIYRISAVAATGTPDTLYLAYEVYGFPRAKVMVAKVTDFGEHVEHYRAEGLVVEKGTSYGVLAALKADPRAPEKLYALVTADPGNDEIFALFQALWVSADGGRNWERLNPPLADRCLYPDAQLDPSDSSVLIVCGNDLFKSTDGGASWTPKPLPNRERIWSLQSGTGSRAVWFGNRLGVIWKSTDGAETWQRIGALPAESDQRFLTPHPVDPSLIFTSTRDGVSKSQDGGETWTPVTEASLLAERPLPLLVIDPQAPDVFYLVNWMRQRVRLGQ